MNERLPLGSVAIVSGAALANEVLLTRYFAIIHWHHYAYMMISLALLGLGASGTFIVLARRTLERRFEQSYIANLVGFGALAVGGPLVALALPFQAEQLLWDPWQPAWLALTYLALALPFFCAANAIGLSLLRWRARAGRVYGSDLVGAGMGSLTILGLLYVVPPEAALKFIAVAGPAAALVAITELRFSSRPAILISVTALLLLAAVPVTWLHPDPGPYKALSQALRVDGTRIVAERSSPLGRIDVIDSPRVPLRYAPGLSLMASGEPPPQLGLFTDGDAPDAITAATGESTRLEFLRASTGALAYRIATPRSVLVIGAGGGLEILRARQLGAARIEALERNRQVADLLRGEFRDYTGGLAAQPGVDLIVGDARGELASHARTYDLIVLPLAGADGSGLGGLGEDYLRTVEAFELYLSRISPGGFLSITGHVQVPPREGLKILATAAVALERAGVREPARRLLMIRSWQAVTLLIKNGEITADEIRGLREFCDEHAFDVGWYPRMPRAFANRHNVLARPWFFDGALALLGPDRDRYIATYPFDLRPATDDRPFFQNHFRWSTFIEGWRTRDRGGLALLETGYPVLVATVLQALVAGSLLILLPLAVLRRYRSTTRGKASVFAYFAGIGVAFMFVEVVFMQKLVRIVHHPTVALAVTLATFLLAAGAGSLWTSRLPSDRTDRGRLGLIVGGIALLGLAYALGFDALFTAIDPWPTAARIAMAVALLAPLAFLMGAPFPLALRRLDAAFVPWAWGINGCASVVSPPLAIVLAVDLGFTVVLCVALAIYAATIAMLPALQDA